ncbi:MULTISPECIES: hypothetical protein [unclassified Acinetobacter]|uniref:hypothetical protein n=1 Tax=unclassified Acinetobacter TaxID=196816 RepID=UPI003A8C34D4
MVDDFNKKPPLNHQADVTQKKRIPVYILILVGIFLLALLFYMFSDMKPDASDAPAGHPNPNVQPATPNNSTPVGEPTQGTATMNNGTEATATDGTEATATATDGQATQ